MACQTCNPSFATLSTAHPIDLEDRLRTNGHTSSLDTIQIAKFLSEAEADMARCDAEIFRLRSLVISLQNRREEMRIRRDGYNSLLAPIRRLPNEVLNDIFLLCRGENYLCGPGQSAVWPPLLLTLGEVCVYWRKTIVSTPSLWSAISVDIDEEHEGPSFGLLDLYLRRSGQSPLTISLRIGYTEQEKAEQVLQRLIQHSHRWRYVTLYLDSNIFRGDTIMALRGKLPLLQRLELEADFDLEEEENPDNLELQAFESMPSMHTLHLGACSSRMMLPWAQVVHLDRRECTPSQFLRCLSLCTNVETVEVSGCNCYDAVVHAGNDWPAGMIRNVTSPRLRTFSLTLDEQETLSSLFGAVTFPSVTSISIRSWQDKKFKWPQDLFTSFISRSSCNLRTLCLYNIFIPDVHLIAILQMLPTLHHLVFEHGGFSVEPQPAVTDNLLRAMSAYSSRAPFLPNLQTIDLHTSRPTFSDQAFVDMVQSRWSPAEVHGGGRVISCLRSVSLRVLHGTFDSAKLDILSVLARAGMRVSISDQGGRVM